jgi:glycine/D-amino acid oxidase-like deaminating enzyme
LIKEGVGVPDLRWKRPALLGCDGQYDVVVIGGGHNGLAAAAYLSRAGRSVLVLEARDILGGFATTEATVPQAPGYLMNPYAADFVLGNILRPSTTSWTWRGRDCGGYGPTPSTATWTPTAAHSRSGATRRAR